MGRYHSIDLLPVAQHEQGIEQLSRSALGRYIPQLRARDEMKVAPAEDNIVTIVERSTGEVRVVKTTASAAYVAAQIAKISGPNPVS